MDEATILVLAAGGGGILILLLVLALLACHLGYLKTLIPEHLRDQNVLLQQVGREAEMYLPLSSYILYFTDCVGMFHQLVAQPIMFT